MKYLAPQIVARRRTVLDYGSSTVKDVHEPATSCLQIWVG